MTKPLVDIPGEGASVPMSPAGGQTVKLDVMMEAAAAAPPPPPPRLLDCMRQAIRVRHFAIRTKQAYVDWAKRLILVHGKRHPQDMGAAESEAFLTYLAVERGVAPATQSQAKAAPLFPYRKIPGEHLR